MLKNLITFCFFLFAFSSLAQINLNFVVTNEKGEEIKDAAIYIVLNSDSSKAFIGFTDEKGHFARKIPKNFGVLISYLGYEDYLLSDYAATKVVLKKQTEELNTFVVSAKKIDKPFELITYALNKGVALYGDGPKYYSIEMRDVIQHFDSEPIYYNSAGYYKEDTYNSPKKVGLFLKDEWSLNWDLYSEGGYDTTKYGWDYFVFVSYAYSSLFDGNPFLRKSPINDKKLSKKFTARIEYLDKGEILCHLKSLAGASSYTLKFSADSILLESDYYRTDSIQVNVPGKKYEKIGFSPMRVRRKWAYENGQYFIKEFHFSGYYFVEMKRNELYEYMISEDVDFTPLNSKPDAVLIKIPISIPPAKE